MHRRQQIRTGGEEKKQEEDTRKESTNKEQLEIRRQVRGNEGIFERKSIARRRNKERSEGESREKRSGKERKQRERRRGEMMGSAVVKDGSRLLQSAGRGSREGLPELIRREQLHISEAQHWV
ncbi:hypothetical protein JOQ06_027169 [Pogonophryne albipinna]|uniref:Uncharacterized protein n=1 Tax=Pogonophryne albipinna TaxID=1090488 RepID=A0AAD6BA73_9TELE|nr:hypothetical protein JOQ06_027169 [Pogonophryne albipinna]